MLEKTLSASEVVEHLVVFNIFMYSLFTVIGFALIVWSIIKIVTRVKKKKIFSLIDGIVVDYAVSRSSDVYTYGIIVEYIVNGVSYRINPTIYTNFERTKHPIGSLVKVRYNPENPADAIFDKDGSSILVLIGGIIFIAIGLFMFFR